MGVDVQQALGPQTLEQPLGTRWFVRCDSRDELSALDMLARRKRTQCLDNATAQEAV